MGGGVATTLVVLTPWWPTARRPWFCGFIRAQAEALARRVPVEVLLCRPVWKCGETVLSGSVPLRSCTVPLLPRHVSAPRSWHLAGHVVSAALGRCAPSAALVHTETLGAIAGPALDRSGIPYVIVLHGEDTSPRPTATAARREAIASALRRAAGVILVGRPLNALLERLAPGLEGRVVENGYDAEIDDVSEPAAPFAHEGPMKITCVGNLQAEKGHDDLLAGLGLLAERGIDFRVELIGEGPLRKELTRKAEIFGGRVKFRGALAPAAAASAIAASDVFVLPSRREALGIVYLNAMALGRPVIGVRGTGIDGVVADGKTGFLVPPRCPDALAEVLVGLRADPERAQRVGEAGRLLARESFSWDRNADRVLAHLKKDCSVA